MVVTSRKPWRHDPATPVSGGVGQELTGVALLLRSMASEVTAEGKLHTVLDQVIGYVNSAIESTRTLAKGLAPLQLDGGNPERALVCLANQARKLHRLEVQARCGPLQVPLLPEVALHLYRIAQEAVNNVVKHAGGTRVDLRLESNATRTVLSIRDNGGGLRTSDSPQGPGIGLQLMRYRAGLAGGTPHIGSSWEHGTEVSCTIMHMVH
jgi:two-component system, NarL family, sensor histidine kinase UhpB